MPEVFWTKEKLDEVKEVFKQSSSVKNALESLSKKYSKLVTADSLRGAFRRNGENGTLELLVGVRTKGEKLISQEKPTPEVKDLIELLKNKRARKKLVSLRYICDKLDIPPKTAENLIGKAAELGYTIEVEAGSLYINSDSEIQDEIPKIKISKGKTRRVKFAVISDTHAGSSAALPTFVTDFVKYAYNEHGIKTILHGGDILTGNSVYRAQVAELDMWGCQNQCEQASEMLPQLDGLKYYGILGNHDVNFIKLAGVDPGYILHKERPDINIIGHLKASFVLDPVGILIELVHIKSSAHAKSYALEKHIAKVISKGHHPDMIFAGHRHTSGYWELNGIHSFMCPCFENENMFVKYFDFIPSIGGIIVDLEVDSEGSISSCAPIFKSYSVPKEAHTVVNGE